MMMISIFVKRHKVVTSEVLTKRPTEVERDCDLGHKTCSIFRREIYGRHAWNKITAKCMYTGLNAISDVR